MGDRATCWSITINNPTPEDVLCKVSGWKLTGQHEIGQEGTPHFQGMLKTPQVRFTAVKKEFPRAHIEVAKSPAALQKYVHKEETRVAVHDEQLNMFSAQKVIANKWDPLRFTEIIEDWIDKDPSYGDIALRYVDELVGIEIESGTMCLEFIGINPMWRSSWKRFYSSIIKRHAAQNEARTPPPPPPPPSPPGAGPACSSEAA